MNLNEGEEPSFLPKITKVDYNDIMDRVSYSDLIELRDTHMEKKECVKTQQYQKAAELRDKEKQFFSKHNIPNLSSNQIEELISMIREHKLNKILDEKEIDI